MVFPEAGFEVQEENGYGLPGYLNSQVFLHRLACRRLGEIRLEAAVFGRAKG